MKEKIDKFRKYCELIQMNTHTINAYTRALNRYFTWLNDNGLYDLRVKKTDVVDFKNHLRQENTLASGTINNILGAIKLYYKYLMSNGLVIKNPVDRSCFVKRKQKLIRNILDEKKLGIFLSKIHLETSRDYMFKSMCEIMYSCGLRISECLTIKEEYIDRFGGYLTIFDIKKKSLRTLPIGDTALRWLFMYIDNHRKDLVSEEELKEGYIYPHSQKHFLYFQSRLARESKKHGFPRLTSHSFRHCCATHLLKKGASVKHVQEFLGHNRLRTTQVYTHLIKDDLKDLVKKHHPRGS